LASSSHCPVAVVRGHDPFQAEQQWVVAELDRSPAGEGVLRRGFEEAQLRGVPLRVLTAWQLRFTDVHDGGALADGTRLAEAQLGPSPRQVDEALRRGRCARGGRAR